MDGWGFGWGENRGCALIPIHTPEQPSQLWTVRLVIGVLGVPAVHPVVMEHEHGPGRTLNPSTEAQPARPITRSLNLATKLHAVCGRDLGWGVCASHPG